MADRSPWLTIIGMGEDGPDGLSLASRIALDQAEIIMAPPRHLDLLSLDASVDVTLGAQLIPWPVPYNKGIETLLSLRDTNKNVVVLASGDPFWYGAGSVLTRQLEAGEWRAFPGVSTFSWAASRLGWPLETTHCLGLHATPFAQMRPYMAPSSRLIVLLRDAPAVAELARYITNQGFGGSELWIMSSLGGACEHIFQTTAESFTPHEEAHPLCVAIKIIGPRAAALTLSSGKPDTFFATDGVMTKRPIRALTLSTLAPHPYEHLWDIGGGSGSIAIEWVLSHPTCSASIVENRPERIAFIKQNSQALVGGERLHIHQATAPKGLESLLSHARPPDAVFIGGGLSLALLEWLENHLSRGTRLVANGVTLEAEALLIQAQTRWGGDLMRLEISRSEALGPNGRRMWRSAIPILQWSAVL